MGIGGIGIWQLMIILLIVVMLFGTKKLRNLGGDVGGALKGFKNAMKEDEPAAEEETAAEAEAEVEGETIDATAEKVETK